MKQHVFPQAEGSNQGYSTGALEATSFLQLGQSEEVKPLVLGIFAQFVTVFLVWSLRLRPVPSVAER